VLTSPSESCRRSKVDLARRILKALLPSSVAVHVLYTLYMPTTQQTDTFKRKKKVFESVRDPLRVSMRYEVALPHISSN
jgi:hypothetical protein